MKKQNQAFTLVELIVVITIITILGTIAFITLEGYSAQARDSKRLGDIQNIKKSLELFSVNTGKYPLPDSGTGVLYDTDIVWTQGIVGDNVSINLSRNLQKKPIDPLTELEYTYSTIYGQTQYEVLGIYESDLVSSNNLLNQSNAATQSFTRLDGNYNGLFVKTEHYYFATPSIVTSELIPEEGLILDSTNITSQITTGGENLPLQGITNSSTGELDIKIGAYEGIITESSTVEERQDFIESIQYAYSDSDLSTQDIYKDLLSVSPTNEDLIKTYVESVVLNKEIYSPNVSINGCLDTVSGETKNFYSTTNVLFEISCDTVKKNFTCKDGIWLDLDTSANILDYPETSCNTNLPKDCTSDSNYTINGHNYNLVQLNHNDSSSPIVDVLENNGTFRYTFEASCDDGDIIGNETLPDIQSCISGYGIIGETCVDTQAPTITSVTTSEQSCETIRFTINGAGDNAGLNSLPYSFDGGSTWQALNYKDFSGTTNYTVNVKVKDLAGNIYIHSSSTNGTASSCTNITLVNTSFSYNGKLWIIAYRLEDQGFPLGLNANTFCQHIGMTYSTPTLSSSEASDVGLGLWNAAYNLFPSDLNGSSGTDKGPGDGGHLSTRMNLGGGRYRTRENDPSPLLITNTTDIKPSIRDNEIWDNGTKTAFIFACQ